MRIASTTSEDRHPWWQPLVATAGVIAAAEGLTTAFNPQAVQYGWRGSAQSVEAGLMMAAIDLLVVGAVAGAIGWIAERPLVRIGAARLLGVLGDGPSRERSLAAVFLAWLSTLAICAIVQLAPVLFFRASQAAAVLAIVALTVGAVGLPLLLAAAAARKVLSVLPLPAAPDDASGPTSSRRVLPKLHAGVRVAVAASVAPLAWVLHHRPVQVTTAVGVVSLAVFTSARGRALLGHVFGGRLRTSAAALCAVILGISSALRLSLPRGLDPAVTTVIPGTAPIAELALLPVSLLLRRRFGVAESRSHNPALSRPQGDDSGLGESALAMTRQDDLAAHAVLPQPLNIVLLHLDTLRPDHTGFGGYRRRTTPELDRLRAEATWFERAYAAHPTTYTSVAALFTGVARGAFIAAAPSVLRPELHTVAEQLSAAGTNTVAVSNLGAGHTDAWRGFRKIVTYPPQPEHDSRLAADQIIKVARSLAEPYFLFGSFVCAHAPHYSEPSFSFGAGGIDEYDASIATCDHHVGRVLDELRGSSAWDRTAVIVYSDHGDSLGTDGVFGHGVTPREVEIRAVLLIRVPGEPARTISSPVSLIDLAPTMLALRGKTPVAPESFAWNLLPFLSGADPSAMKSRPIFFTAGGVHRIAPDVDWQSVVQMPYKYSRERYSGFEYLFDLEKDPWERKNIRDSEPHVRDQLARLTDDWETVTGVE